MDAPAEIPAPDVDRQCREISVVCRDLVPDDLVGFPLYVIPLSSLKGAARHSKCAGWTSRNLWRRLRGHRHFVGPGYAMVLNDLMAIGQARAALRSHPTTANRNPIDLIAVMRDVVWYWLLETALHELAHIVDGPPLSAPLQRPRSRGATNSAPFAVACSLVSTPREVAEHYADRRQDETLRETRHPFAGGDHGERFIRAAIHIESRFRRTHDWEIDICAAGREYGLSPLQVYREALGDETQRLRGEPLREILDSKPPDAFLLRYLNDFVAIDGKLPGNA